MIILLLSTILLVNHFGRIIVLSHIKKATSANLIMAGYGCLCIISAMHLNLRRLVIELRNNAGCDVPKPPTKTHVVWCVRVILNVYIENKTNNR
jgi:hypothetical protein